MANERDPEGDMLCPVCREVIRDPDLRSFMGDQRVREMPVVAVQSMKSVSLARDTALA